MRNTLLLFMFLISGACIDCDRGGKSTKEAISKIQGVEPLQVSPANPHLLETVSGIPVFLNNFTAWELTRKISREDMADLIMVCKSNQFNMISAVLLNPSCIFIFINYRI